MREKIIFFMIFVSLVIIVGGCSFGKHMAKETFGIRSGRSWTECL